MAGDGLPKQHLALAANARNATDGGGFVLPENMTDGLHHFDWRTSNILHGWFAVEYARYRRLPITIHPGSSPGSRWVAHANALPGGKSGPRRAGCRLTAGRYKLQRKQRPKATESATERYRRWLGLRGRKAEKSL